MSLLDDQQMLPHLDFDSVNCIDSANAKEEEEFDVFSAANGQRRRRSSIMSYTGKSRASKEEDENDENINKENVMLNSPGITTTTPGKQPKSHKKKGRTPSKEISQTNKPESLSKELNETVTVAVAVAITTPSTSSEMVMSDTSCSIEALTIVPMIGETESEEENVIKEDNDTVSVCVPISFPSSVTKKTSSKVMKAKIMKSNPTKARVSRNISSSVDLNSSCVSLPSRPTTQSRMLASSNTIDTGAIKRSRSVVLSRPTSRSMAGAVQSNKVSALNSRQRSRSASASMASSRQSALKPTLPVTPNFRVEKRLKMQQASRALPLSTEERELAEVAKAKKEAEVRLQKAKKVFERVKVQNATNVKTVFRSTKELTIPTTPVSHLSKRLGSKQCSIAGTSTGNVSSSPPPAPSATGSRGCTVVEPFHFATDSRISSSSSTRMTSASAATSAEIGEKFLRDARSHYVPVAACKKLTEAKAPNLKTSSRSLSRPLPQSREEAEVAAIQAIKPFKARPVDPRVFQSRGEMGVPKIAAKPLTEPAPFEFRTDKRCSVLAPPAAPTPSSPPHPVSTWDPRPTVAISPKLSGGRASSAPARRQKPHHSLCEKEKREKDLAVNKRSSLSLTLTEPKEFQLKTDARHRVSVATLEERVKYEREREALGREIKAKPVPKLKKFEIEKTEKPLTEVEQFNLRSVARHEDFSEQLQREKMIAEERDHAQREVHAKPLPRSTFEATFKLNDSQRRAVKPKEVVLESDSRSAKRKEFDQLVAAKMAEAEKRREGDEEAKRQKELHELKELRRKSTKDGGLAFKATSVDTIDHFPTKTPVSLPLTEPKSPYLRTKMRSRPEVM